MKLLLIEDEPTLIESLTQQLKSHCHTVDSALDGEEGLFLAQEYHYDLIILDLGLPKRPGLEILETLRQNKDSTPILILTARNSWQERVEGLNKGADDYLGKPFHFEELLARIQTLLKRHNPLLGASKLCDGDICLDQQSHTLSVSEKVITPTAQEFQLLQAFFSQPDKVFSKTALLELISDHQSEKGENLIEVYINHLRHYLGKSAIQTLRGQGYKLTLNPQPQ
jgi:DNA-binding response OmpR family regulator